MAGGLAVLVLGVGRGVDELRLGPGDPEMVAGQWWWMRSSARYHVAILECAQALLRFFKIILPINF